MALVIAVWFALTAAGLVPPTLLPGPVAVWDSFTTILLEGYRQTSLWHNALVTLWRCMAGFLLAVAVGVPLGLAMGMWWPLRAACGWIVEFLRPLPPLSYMVLLILWLGIGDRSKIALLFLTAFPIILTSAMAGVWGVKENRLRAARSLGAGPWQIFRLVVFPSALPMIFTGCRIALAAAFSTVVAAELMAANDGLGWMVLSASRFLRNDVIIVGILALGLMGMALSRLVLVLDRRVVHWRGVD